MCSKGINILMPPAALICHSKLSSVSRLLLSLQVEFRLKVLPCLGRKSRLVYLSRDEEFWDGEPARRKFHGLALADDGRTSPVAVAAGVGHASRHLLSQPNKNMAAIVQNGCRVCSTIWLLRSSFTFQSAESFWLLLIARAFQMAKEYQ